jgi:hypothetical protein
MLTKIKEWIATKRAIRIIHKWVQKDYGNHMLNLSNLGLHTLPPIPQDLCRFFDCSNNNLTTLPELPNCEHMVCNNNKLVSLPEMPKCHFLNCSNNQLSALPNMPFMSSLKCNNNKLTALSDMPSCRFLWCENNKLVTLPKELRNCVEFRCSNNNLMALPSLPYCYRLYCRHNNLLYLPKLPGDHMSEYDLANNNYLHITRNQALVLATHPTPDYNKCALKIQRVYRRHMIKKYREVLQIYLTKDTTGIVIQYIAAPNGALAARGSLRSRDCVAKCSMLYAPAAPLRDML